MGSCWTLPKYEHHHIVAQSDQQIIDAVNEAVTYAMELAADAEGWKVEKEQGDAVIKTKKNKDGRKVWLCTATVNVSPSLLWEKMKDTDNLTSWNGTVPQSHSVEPSHNQK